MITIIITTMITMINKMITITTMITIITMITINTRFFDKIFATGHQITEFHSLLAQSAKSSVITEVRLS